MKNNDKGMRELLELLKTRPELISALVFDPASIKRLLGSKAARRLVLGVDTKAFLSHVVSSKEDGPIALCLRRTASLCAAATRCGKRTMCAGGTLCTGGTDTGRR